MVVDKGKLKLNGRIEIIEKITPVFKNGVLIVLLGKLIVNVKEADRIGLKTLVHTADTVLAHFTVSDAFLCG